jgi:hypothetical protein
MKPMNSQQATRGGAADGGLTPPGMGRSGLRVMIPGVTRQLAVPQGFTLSTSGAFAILLQRHPAPGTIAIWLFVVGAGVGYAAVAMASKAHRSNAVIGSVRGLQLFNLSPIVVVPLISLVHWWIQGILLAYSLAGVAAGVAYPLAVSVLFLLSRPQPR